MFKQEILEKIKEAVEEFFQKMTLDVDVKTSFSKEVSSEKEDEKVCSILINVDTQEPQLLIGERGQTLNEIQQLLRAILRRKIKEIIFIDLDISDYKKKKIEYLKELARSLADEVSLSGKEKTLPPMSSYERRIIHLELAKREDIITESVGEEPERKIVVKPSA